MFIQELNGGQCKSYLIADTRVGRAALIDPVMPKYERYLGTLGYLNCRLDFCIETHTHADHITASCAPPAPPPSPSRSH